MITPVKHVYGLDRGPEAVNRINLTQFVWAQTLGYLLHPTIPQDVMKVAEIATASGLWLCELNAERTRLQKSHKGTLNDYEILDGYDISNLSFLPDDQKPSKVILREQDAREEPPAELKGKYDVVHIRLISPGIKEGPSEVIKHCLALLRPGGYLQWEEFDFLDYKIVMHDGSDPDSSHLKQVVNTFGLGRPMFWIQDLPNTMEKHGFTIKAVDRTRDPEWLHTILTHMVCGVMDEVARNAIDKVGPPGAGDALRAEIKAALEENAKGSYLSSLFQVVVAQKPE